MVLARDSDGTRSSSRTARACRLANKIGYDPQGLGEFLARLSDRNKAAREKQGLFASHPGDEGAPGQAHAQIEAEKLASTATLEERYHQYISYKAKAQAEIAAVAAGSSGLAAGSAKKEDKAAEGEQQRQRRSRRRRASASASCSSRRGPRRSPPR